MAATAGGSKAGDASDMMAMVGRVGIGGALAGLLGGAAMMGLMVIVMGAEGSGYATPLNLGIPAFAKTIAPPPQTLPTLVAAMGIHLPPEAMAQLKPALAHGYLSPAMAHQLGGMLAEMHQPAAKVGMIGDVMTGHASNGTMANLLSELSPSARHEVMRSMPVSGGNVAIGLITHFALAAILGVTFAVLIVGVGIGRLSLSALRTPAGIVGVSVLGGAIVYAVNRWLILPAIDPMMRLVPEGWFFVAHLLFGLLGGLGVATIASREGALGTHARASAR